jgi:hypothetical protein
MTTPVTGMEIMQLEMRHQNQALDRIENKIDKVTDDHEKRLRVIEAADPVGVRADVEGLQKSDRQWAALLVVLNLALVFGVKLLWP